MPNSTHFSWSRTRRLTAALAAAVTLAMLWAGAISRAEAAEPAPARVAEPAAAKAAESVPAEATSGTATGHASVHLVRFLDEVSESDRARFGPLHDIRLRLEAGFVVLVRREGDFAAILPIETREGSPDSLQYFWYLERGPFLWFIPRGRDRGVRTVSDGGDIRFDSFTLRWGKGGDRGWLYFPDIPENRGVRVSVVSGNSVDRVDPRETRYWVELGAPGPGGF